jgi:hypothetical protein
LWASGGDIKMKNWSELLILGGVGVALYLFRDKISELLGGGTLGGGSGGGSVGYQSIPAVVPSAPPGDIEVSPEPAPKTQLYYYPWAPQKTFTQRGINLAKSTNTKKNVSAAIVVSQIITSSNIKTPEKVRTAFLKPLWGK